MTASAAPDADASAAATDYPHGHLGHLSAQQHEALARFKDVLERRGLLASHDDQTLLRFLRARAWVIDDALRQLSDTQAWRAANSIDTLYRTIDLDAYEQSRRLYPQWTGRRDRRGLPLYVFEIRTLDSKTVSEYDRAGAASTFSEAETDGKTQPGVLRLFALYENLMRFSLPFCTQLTDREHSHVPITMGTNIVDISGVGLKQFWNLKGHMQVASQLATAHYPETLDRIFIIGAPFFFSTVWSMITRWFDSKTVSKIFVLGPHEVKPTLEAFIEPRNLPKKYGGELDFDFGQLSVPDPAWEGVVRWEDPSAASFPTGPLVWEEIDGGERLACVALGTEGGTPRRRRICTMPKAWPPAGWKTETNGNGAVAAGESTESTAGDSTIQETATGTVTAAAEANGSAATK